MTLLELWVHTPLAQSLGFALAHSLWEGAAIAVLLAVTLLIVRSAPARYGAACVAMLLMLGSFGVTVARLMPQPIELTKAPHIAVRAAAPAALPQFPEAPPEPRTLAAFLPWIAPFWAAGVLFFHIRSLGGWLAARRLRRAGVCPAPSEWQGDLDAIARRLRVSKPVALLESCLAEVPVVIGYARPVILMPVGLLAGLPVAQVEAILIHELAHIRRQDYLVNLMQTFVEGLLFYHPAVWWISSVIRAERENCCDDLAVAATGDARQYAAALTALEQNRSAAQQLALAATGGSLVKRIRRVLHQPERPRAVWTPAISATLLLVGAGIALANWQAATEPQPQAARVPVVSAAPAAAPSVELPVVQLPAAAPPTIDLPTVQFRKPAPVQAAQAQLAQAQQPLTPVAQQLKDQLEREVAGRTTLTTPYTKWLNEDVPYIITNEERAKYKALATDDDREQFIEQFWQIRNPLPNSASNPFKTEHYRRIGFANEHFSTTTSVPGWKTDRGRIYITFGPPDEIDDHSSGGTYNRPPEEGGGTTQTFPFQQWRYKYIQGVGTNIVVEFIDPTYTKEFRMTADPSDKDALKFVRLQQPNAQGLNNTDGTHLDRPSNALAGRGGSAASTPQSPAASSAPVGNMFVSSGDGPKLTLTVTTAKRDNVNIAWPIPAGTNGLDIIGRITDANGKTIANVRDVTQNGQSNYAFAFSLPTGNYTLDFLARERATGAIQTTSVTFYVN